LDDNVRLLLPIVNIAGSCFYQPVMLILAAAIQTMKFLTAFFRLVRWPNLVFIAITQLLF
jgi:hypothetical protein